MINTTQEQNPTSTLSLGQQLKNARESLNLSIEDVVAETNLKKSHLESLENDIFILQNVAPTFVRGYVRNYVRFLRLPEELVNSVNYGEVTIPKEMNTIKPANVTQKSQNKWVKYLTILVLLATISMTLVWWWQDYQAEQDNRNTIVSNAISLEATKGNAVEPISLPVQEPTAAAQTTEAAKGSQAETNAPVQAVESAQISANVPNNVQPAVDEQVNVLKQPEAEVTQAEPVPAAVGNDELRIEITGKESWITVRGSGSKKSLAEKLYTNGEVLTFNGNEQYRLTIGAPVNVKVYYKGQEVPLKIDGRVARITLPL